MDLGGPKREIFRLFAAEVSESTFVQGGEQQKVFLANVQGVQVSYFYFLEWLYS